MTTQKDVLIVDDDPDIREVLRLMLENLGYTPHDFSTVDAAIASTANRTYSAALVDIALPGRDGYSFLSEVRQSPTLESLPVVLVTARTSDEDMLEGYRNGADYYISKPFSTAQLRVGLNLMLLDSKTD